MVADAVKHIVHTLIMSWLLNRSLNGLRGYGIATSAVKSFGAALVTGLSALGVMALLLPIFPLDSLLNRVIVVLLGGLAGVAGYTVMVFVLDIKIAKSLPGLLRRRKKANIA